MRVLLLFSLIIALTLIGCQSYFTEEGVEEVGLKESIVETGDAAVGTIEAATPIAREALNLAPEPYRSGGRALLELLGGAVALWQIIRNIRLTKGARKTAKVLETTIKHKDAWNTVGPALSEEANKYVLVKPIMPDKA